MKMFAFCLVLAAVVASSSAVVNKERREAPFETYGPPPHRPAAAYGPPPQRQYGVPQQLPFREYGVPALKYGPPKLPLHFGGGPNLNHIGGGFKSSIHEQVKNHFGVPKPFYGPPHQRPIGPPPGKPFTQYGPLPPKPVYGPPLPPQQLPLPRPAPLFRPGPGPRPHGQYGPPPQAAPAPVYGPPSTVYGVPETTVIITGASAGAEAHQHHTSEIEHLNQVGGVPSLPIQEVQIHVESNGLGHAHSHTHGHAQGSPFPTSSCDGWKPIPAPVGHYVEHNLIQEQTTGYAASNSASSSSFSSSNSVGSTGGFSTGAESSVGGYTSGADSSVIGYSSSASTGGFSSGAESSDGGYTSGADSSVIGYSSSASSSSAGLTDDQLIAVALQSGGFDSPTHQVIPLSGPTTLPSEAPAPEFHNEQHVDLNSVSNVESLQLSQGSISDSYSKPPADSYAPNSIHAERYNTVHVSSGLNGGVSGPSRPSAEYGPPPPRPSALYGPPPSRPSAHYGPPPSRPGHQYGPPPSAPHSQYGPPRPAAQYGPPPSAAFQQSSSSHHSSSNFESSNIGIQYGTVSGNVRPYPNAAISVPRSPVAYRPPVPQGLLESIGASVEHLDTFGVKPEGSANIYIPPPSAEIAQHFSGAQYQELNGFGDQQINSQALPSFQEARFNQQQDCGHGPNLVGGDVHFHQEQLQQQQQQQLTGYSSNIADSYGPPPSGSSFDITGYASQKSVVTSLPQEAGEQLPGLAGLNVISAQQSESVSIPINNQGQQGTYQLQIQAGPANGDQQTNHDQILSEGLLQSILTAIEQPKNGQQQQQQQPQLQKRADHQHTDADSQEKSSEKSEAAASSEETSK